MPVAPPSQEALDSVLAPVTNVTRRVDIYESDATTLWEQNARILGGGVNCDADRDEQRSFDLIFDNRDGRYGSDPDEFWYDKIIKPYRGVIRADGETEDWQLGEFMIDQIEDAHFPHEVKVTGRDLTKKLIKSKFGLPTNFTKGQIVEQVIKNIALNAGITRFNFDITGQTLQQDYLFEMHSERWPAIKDLAIAHGYEVKFDAQGYMILQEFRDPVTDPAVWTFSTGEMGMVSEWARRAKDDRLYNHVSVVGESSSGILAWAEARNTNPTSPSRIARIGERTYPYKSAFITSNSQAQQIANNFLAVFSLESWEIDLGSIVLPWLEQGEVVEFVDDQATSGNLTRWRLSNMTIPMSLDPMSVQARRVEIVT
jgi:hypothetical protein